MDANPPSLGGLLPPKPVRHGADGSFPNGSSEVILEHQLSLQRMVLEWAARYEHLVCDVARLARADAVGLKIADAASAEHSSTRIHVNDPPPPPPSMPVRLLTGSKPVKTMPEPMPIYAMEEPMSTVLGKVNDVSPSTVVSGETIATRRDGHGALLHEPREDIVAVESGSITNTESGEKVEERMGAADSIFGALKKEFDSDLKQLCRTRTTNLDLDKQDAKSHSIVRMCKKIDRSVYFKRCCAAVILTNASCLSFTTEFAVRQPSDPTFEVFQNFERLFCLFYLVEIMVRLISQRKQFCVGEDMCWNLFDLLLAGLSAQEQVMSIWSEGLTGQDLSYLRIIRLMKMIKFLRMIRLMRAFRELRLVMDSMLGSMRALIWSFLLVAFICFMFALCFVQAANDLASSESEGASCTELREAGDSDAEVTSSDTAQFACVHWGSIGSAMLSLFQASTAGYDWEILARPLLKAGGMYYAIFCFYIGFFLFIVMNSVTSLFLDNVMTNSQCNEDQIMQDQLARKKQYMSKVVQIFSHVDEDGSGAITYEEFADHKRDPLLVAFANSLDIEPDALEQFFSLLSGGGKRAVDLETFVVGCIRVRGAAKSMDLMDVLITQQRLEEEQGRFTQFCEEQFLAIRQGMSGSGTT